MTKTLDAALAEVTKEMKLTPEEQQEVREALAQEVARKAMKELGIEPPEAKGKKPVDKEGGPEPGEMGEPGEPSKDGEPGEEEPEKEREPGEGEPSEKEGEDDELGEPEPGEDEEGEPTEESAARRAAKEAEEASEDAKGKFKEIQEQVRKEAGRIEQEEQQAEREGTAQFDISDDEEAQSLATRKMGKIGEFKETPDVIAVKNQLTTQLKKLKDLLGPRVLRSRSSGVFDVRSAMRAEPVGSANVFRRRIPDNRKNAEMIVVIVMDGSGSMGGDKNADANRIRSARKAAWAITGAVEKIGGAVAVIVYWDDQYKIVKPFHKPAWWDITSGGGTFPARPNQLALDLLMKEDKAHTRLLINITDGAWQGGRGRGGVISTAGAERVASEAVLRTAEREGIITIEVLIETKEEHGSKFVLKIPAAGVIQLPQELLKVIRKIQLQIFRRVQLQ